MNHKLLAIRLKLRLGGGQHLFFTDILREVHSERPNSADLLVAIQAKQELSMVYILETFVGTLFRTRQRKLPL